MMTNYLCAHPESELGKKFFDGSGDPDWILVAIKPNGLLVLRKREPDFRRFDRMIICLIAVISGAVLGLQITSIVLQ
jgi:hypothetical protein